MPEASWPAINIETLTFVFIKEVVLKTCHLSFGIYKQVFLQTFNEHRPVL